MIQEIIFKHVFMSHRIPVLKLKNAKGLSNDKVLELEREVQCMATDLVGEVKN